MSLLRDVLEAGEFAITAEIAPPKGTDLSRELNCARAIKNKVHGINVTDFQSAVLRATSLVTCKLLKDQGAEPIFQITGRDRNRIAIQGELLAANILGIENVLALTGDHTSVGDHPQAKAVYDLDSVGILQAAQTLMQGKDMAGKPLKGKPNFYLGACVTPGYEPLELQIIKMVKKINSGARFFQTQAIFDIDTMRRFRDKTKFLDSKILAGIVPLKSPGMARYMNKNIPGIHVPEILIRRMEATDHKYRLKEGMRIAAELIQKLKEENLCEGVHIMAIGAEENVSCILEMACL